MKRADFKVVAIILSIALLLTLVCSNAVSVASIVMLTKANKGSSTVTTTAVAGTPGSSSVDPGNPSAMPGSANVTSAVTNVSGANPAAPNANNNNSNPGGASSATKSYAQILALYTTVMNKAKSSKPAYNKYEYQEVPEQGRDIRKGGTLVSAMLGIAGNFMKSKDKAVGSPEKNNKGGDMKWFPVYSQAKGCYLTDAGKIKSASYSESNGIATIVITLQSETNPQPMTNGSVNSFTGAMFAPLAKKDIDDALGKPPVSTFAKEIQYSLVYHDCTATLKYNIQKNQAIQLDQIMNVTITGSGKAGFVPIDLTVQLIDTMRCYNFAY